MVSVLPVPYNVNSNMASSNSHYGYVQPPPSPPADDSTKCSLPSISNLLGLADAGSPTSESASHSGSPISGPRSETRPPSSQYSQPNKAMPPTPPMPTKPSFNSYSPARQSIPQQKPAASMTSVSGPGYYYETTPPLDDQRVMPRIQTTPTPQTYTSPPPPPQTYGHSYSLPPFYSAPPPPPGMPGMYYQRPLPQFPPMMATPGANVWQHHHYMSPVSGTPYTQSQDRYICQTCNKAFSRPSSLRIHSHSHTGEKPFKCPHPGCGKAFSVRSNMKRHERGCHNYDSSSSSSHSRNSSPHA